MQALLQENQLNSHQNKIFGEIEEWKKRLVSTSFNYYSHSKNGSKATALSDNKKRDLNHTQDKENQIDFQTTNEKPKNQDKCQLSKTDQFKNRTAQDLSAEKNIPDSNQINTLVKQLFQEHVIPEPE